LTGGLAGAIKAGTDRNYFQKIGDARQREMLLPQIARQQQMEQVKSQRETEAIRRADIIRDDVRLEAQQKATELNQEERRKMTKRKDFRARNPLFDPAKATPAQVRELAEFGETPESIGSYDFTKDQTKTIGGVVFKKNLSTGKYEDAGLPTMPGEQRAEINIIDPTTGKTITLETTSAKAAGLLNSRVVAKMSQDAQAQRQEDTQEFQAGQQQQRLQHSTEMAERNRQMRAPQLLSAMQQYITSQNAKKKSSEPKMTLEDAKQVYRQMGLDVDTILSRQ